jgi:hypothetical protein
MSFLTLATARDIFEKAKREYSRMLSDPNIDNVFNFFVTAYHIRDYIEKTGIVEKYLIDNFCLDSPESVSKAAVKVA